MMFRLSKALERAGIDESSDRAASDRPLKSRIDILNLLQLPEEL